MFACVCLAGCLTKENPTLIDVDYSQISIDYEEAVWVCHHPNTEFHNKLCVDDVYPDGCYVEGDNHKFCWELHRSDCDNNEISLSLEACSLFKGKRL